jgi:hypothetical protein
VSTWETAPALSTGDVSGSWVVLVTLGGLGGVFGLMMAMGIYFDVSERKSNLASVAPVLVAVGGGGGGRENQIQQPRGGLSQWFSIGVSPDPRDMATPRGPLAQSDAATVNPDLQLLEESLPSVFQSSSLWTKFKEEIRVYHRWLGIVFYYSPEFPRSMRVLSLFSSIVIMLFVQSVTYNIADPDDGSCEACKDESRCLSLRSTLSTRESRCYWQTDSSSSSTGSCHFREIGEDMTRMLIVALISAIVSAPFALSVQSLIVNVLSKETIDEEELEKEKQKMHEARLRRTQSLRLRETIASTSTDPVEIGDGGGSSDNDLKKLQTELTAHFKYLKTKSEGVASAKEFRGECLGAPFSVLSPLLTLFLFRLLGLSCGRGE